MTHLLRSIDRDWRTFATSRPARDTLRRWQAAEPALMSIATMPELTDRARDEDRRDLDGRDEIHRALLRLATTDERAITALLHLLYPALTATAWLYSDTWDRDDAASQVVIAAIAYIRRCPDDVPRPAARLVRHVKRAMWNAAEAERQRRRGLNESASVEDREHEDITTRQPTTADEVIAVVAETLEAGAIDLTKARLLVASRVLGIRTADIARASGCPMATIRQRRRRAEAAIIQLHRELVA